MRVASGRSGITSRHAPGAQVEIGRADSDHPATRSTMIRTQSQHILQARTRHPMQTGRSRQPLLDRVQQRALRRAGSQIGQ
ncbi:hypothetical protein ACLZH7_32340 [Streptomyces sp. BG2AG]|uniref:hypothetical protein n=1 Tax=unclassified Streptomyces TaxID=2593676 RepID=UPI0039EF864B